MCRGLSRNSSFCLRSSAPLSVRCPNVSRAGSTGARYIIELISTTADTNTKKEDKKV